MQSDQYKYLCEEIKSQTKIMKKSSFVRFNESEINYAKTYKLKSSVHCTKNHLFTVTNIIFKSEIVSNFDHMERLKK